MLKKIAFSVTCVALIGLMQARADGIDASLAKTGTSDSGIIRITPDMTEVVRLDQDAASIVVANPVHANVVLDSPRLLVVMPRQPGTTSFKALNSKGEIITERQIIVAAAAKPRYVRVRRVCSSSDSSCVPVAYFYCPDGCYEVMPVAPEQGGPAQAPEVISNPTGSYIVSPPTEQGGGPIVTPAPEAQGATP